MDENRANKWKAIAVCEAVLICVIFIIAAALYIRRGSSEPDSISAAASDNMATGTVRDGVLTETGGETAAEMEDIQTAESGSASQPEGTTGELSAADSNGVLVSFKMEAEWESGDAQFAQFAMLLENKTETDVVTWSYILPLKDGERINSFWGCEISLEDDRAVITPAEYTSVIEAGETVENVGIIVEWKKGSSFEPASGSFDFEEAAIAGEISTEASQNEEVSGTVQDTGLNNMTPLECHGGLSVSGTDLVDAYGKKIQLKGVSTHGIAWYPAYITEDTFRTLRDDYHVNTIRLAMYTAEYNGYCTGGDQAALKSLIHDGVTYATELGMYVIIDWHILSDSNPDTYKSEAIAFFDEMSEKYHDYDNVIYEICNEPSGGTSWPEIKSYAGEVIGAIRENDDDAVILVGTPNWSQDVDTAAADRIENDENVMYVLHFYAATHTDALRSKLTAAHEAGLPVFISEFSICDASGNGSIDYDSASKWLSLINEYNLSFVGWNLSNKAESSSILKSSCTKVSQFTKDELSDTGKWLFDAFQ